MSRDNISDIMHREGREKWRALAARGAETYLLLDDANAEEPRPTAGPDAEGAALAAAAEGIHQGLSSAEREAWPGGVAWSLQRLADRSFFPPIPPLAGPPRGEEGAFRALAEGRYVRVVNFHATPRWMAGDLEARLARLAESFAPVSDEDLKGFLGRGEWPHDRPGVIVSFFDGFHDNYEVAAPLLDRLGLIGRFFLVSGWISSPPERQRAFADAHRIDLPYREEALPEDGRLALSAAEVKDLADRGHVIASHTRTHSSSLQDPTPRTLAHEAAGSRTELEEISGGKVSSLAWYAGMALGDDERIAAATRDAGYDLLFANHAVQRVR